MKNGAVVYRGKYGATKQYAEWLAHDLKVPLMEAHEVSEHLLIDLDFIILGSSVYYGKLLMKSFLSTHFKALLGKKLFFFIVCATPESDEKEQKKIVKENIPEKLLVNDNTFFLPGRLDLKALSPFDRTMLRIAAFFEKKSERKTVMSHGIDAVSKEYLIDVDIAVRAFALSKQ